MRKWKRELKQSIKELESSIQEDDKALQYLYQQKELYLGVDSDEAIVMLDMINYHIDIVLQRIESLNSMLSKKEDELDCL